MTDHLPFLRRYLEAVGRMASGPELAAFYTGDAVQEEFPNRITPVTATRTVADILAAAERGKKVMAGQRFEILGAVAQGDTVALETLWTGTLAVPVGGLPAGGEMKARFAVFFEMRDGKIARQRNYDCFDAF
jgi:ketosteroid isomerase-like protein